MSIHTIVDIAGLVIDFFYSNAILPLLLPLAASTPLDNIGVNMPGVFAGFFTGYFTHQHIIAGMIAPNKTPFGE